MILDIKVEVNVIIRAVADKLGLLVRIDFFLILKAVFKDI